MTPDRPLRLLFVCTGNLCRSPLAAALAEQYARQVELPVEVLSAGTMGLVNEPAERPMLRVAAEVGLDLSAHRSQALTEELIGWADHVLAMEMLHMTAIRALAPEVGERAVLLGTYGGMMEIADPYGSWFLRPYRQTRERLDRSVRRFVDVLRAQRRRGGSA